MVSLLSIPVWLVSATRDNVILGLKWLVSSCHAGDQLFFIFCGHGAQVLCECALVLLIAVRARSSSGSCEMLNFGGVYLWFWRKFLRYFISQLIFQLGFAIQMTCWFQCCHKSRRARFQAEDSKITHVPWQVVQRYSEHVCDFQVKLQTCR